MFERILMAACVIITADALYTIWKSSRRIAADDELIQFRNKLVSMEQRGQTNGLWSD